jgi:glycosyltransferase involved in cell wall biosynthesis
MDELLSVIIPVYQAKKYLVECVSSVVNQSYKNIEIILVDDGSTDGSADMCDTLAIQYSGIKVVHINNRGPFVARKIGVELSTGNLVTFVDADDFVEQDAYAELIEIYEKYKPDIISYAYQTSKGSVSENYYDEGYYNREEIEKYIMPTMMYDMEINDRKLNPSVCCKIIKKNIYKAVTATIDEYINWGEDALVTYSAVCMAESVFVSHKVYYNYRSNMDSSMNKLSSNRIDELENWFAQIKRLLSQYDKKYGLDLQIEAYIRIFFEIFIKNRFDIDYVGVRYLFPYSNIPYKSKIKIYGAGVVGKSYVWELLQSKYAEIVGWYDKNAEEISNFAGVCIDNPKKIAEKDSDMILIAIQNENIVKNIRNELIELGINTDKIYWSEPIIRR